MERTRPCDREEGVVHEREDFHVAWASAWPTYRVGPEALPHLKPSSAIHSILKHECLNVVLWGSSGEEVIITQWAQEAQCAQVYSNSKNRLFDVHCLKFTRATRSLLLEPERYSREKTPTKTSDRLSNSTCNLSMRQLHHNEGLSHAAPVDEIPYWVLILVAKRSQ